MEMRTKQTENPRSTQLRSKKQRNELARRNLTSARQIWGDLNPRFLQSLEAYSTEFRFSIIAGDLLYLDNGWYVTHTGLIRLAARRRCRGIQVQPTPEFSDAQSGRYAFQATVYKSRTCRGFAGYGDADPSNVSPLVYLLGRGNRIFRWPTRFASRIQEIAAACQWQREREWEPRP
jgi:hypothetical protein